MNKPRKTQLAAIPSNWRLGGSVRFTKLAELSDGWLLLGREKDLPLGQLVKVTNFSAKEESTVEVQDHVAERVVHHRQGSYSHETEGAETRWVLATFISHPEITE